MEQDPVINAVMERSTSSPEWLAMAGYGLLVALNLNADGSPQTFSTIIGFSLLFISKYLKSKHADDARAPVLQTWGYLFVVFGLPLTRWRDAVAIFAYALAIVEVEFANALIAFVLALNIQDSESLGMAFARMALVVYNI
jgi:hypothetical protein